MAGQIFARFQFKMSFGGISYIATTNQGAPFTDMDK